MGCGASREKCAHVYAVSDVEGKKEREIHHLPHKVHIIASEPFSYAMLAPKHVDAMKEEFPGRDYKYMLTTDLNVTLALIYAHNAPGDDTSPKKEDMEFKDLKAGEDYETMDLKVPKGFLADGASAFVPLVDVNLAVNSMWPAGWWVHDYLYQTSHHSNSCTRHQVKIHFHKLEEVKTRHDVIGQPIVVLECNEQDDDSEVIRRALDGVLIAEHRVAASRMLGKQYFCSEKWAFALPHGSLHDDHATMVSFEQIEKEAADKRDCRAHATPTCGLVDSASKFIKVLSGGNPDE